MQGISESNPISGKNLHDSNACKPVTVALLSPKPSTVLLRLTFIDSQGIDHANSLMTTWMKNPLIKLGTALCEIMNVDMNTTVWGNVQSWQDLLRNPPGANKLGLEFVTPTAINKVDAQKIRFTGLLPDSQSVFMSLARKWNLFGGPAMPQKLPSYLASGGCVVSNYKISTVTYEFPDYKQTGFTGFVNYECRKRDDECADAVYSLARFAFYSGIGYHTSQGMGTVRPYMESM